MIAMAIRYLSLHISILWQIYKHGNTLMPVEVELLLKKQPALH